MESELKELLNSGRILEVSTLPHVVNPLSVSISGEKLRLMLDLSYVNLFVYKDRIKFEDWKIMEEFVEKFDFMFKFDIKSG